MLGPTSLLSLGKVRIVASLMYRTILVLQGISRTVQPEFRRRIVAFVVAVVSRLLLPILIGPVVAISYNNIIWHNKYQYAVAVGPENTGTARQCACIPFIGTPLRELTNEDRPPVANERELLTVRVPARSKSRMVSQ